MPDGRVVVVGAHCPGLLLRVHAVPRPGETVLGWDYDEPLDGGKATNQAVAAARAGAEVGFVTVVGDDDRGRALERLLADEGIDGTHAARLEGRVTDVGVILLADDGIPAIVSTDACTQALDPDYVRGAAGAMAGAMVCLCQLEASQAAATAAFALAREQGAVCVLNPAPAAELDPELLALTDVLVPNEPEARMLTGTDRPPAELAALLAERHDMAVVVTAGPQGAFLAGPQSLHVPAPAADAVDTTGAGDAFVGVLGAGLARGESLADALQRAVGAASRSVAAAGSIPSYPRLDG